MDLEITLAIEKGQHQFQQQLKSRKEKSREQKVVNLVQGLSPYLVTEATTECTNQFSNNQLLYSCESIISQNNDENNYNNMDIDFDLLEYENDESDTDDEIDNQSDDDLTSLHGNRLTEPDQNSALLHQYTHITQNEYCTNLLYLFRQANISKLHSAKILQLISSVLPQPNTAPTTLKALLDYMQVDNLFVKRRVCLLCHNNIALSSDTCFKCNSNYTKQYADVFDADYEKLFSEVIERNYVDINQYRQKIITTQNDETNDIPFQKIFREFQQTVSHRYFISVILHLDGIGLGKSNKLVLWLLSCTIVELPPHLRNKRENMIPLSAWIAPREPIIYSWLNECIQRLKYLKLSGILVGGTKRWFIYFIGVICDCPAMKLILNHIGNNGYYSCWYCKISGIHISNKRQYYFEEAPIMRTIDSYVNESMKAEETRENINGHLGMSILHQILDIRLPDSIMMDYMHITLLRHTRVVAQQLYSSLTRQERTELDNRIRLQQFPHTFHRKMRPISGTHIKYALFKLFSFKIM
ncbi:unnamed protein product [Rotaria sp. Silwood2]|nr:unnamed protein product [Rotaria sp. Silwood2]CAF2996008.1 unnamed protein product [Rotaria sp. Silwood2]CAF3224193.1 unnamed protein product [Rotaria sp. Silwood2]CAF3324181.1 unnamed protein product [Rotaria sp. Silwood2]